jgi:NAD+ synthase
MRNGFDAEFEIMNIIDDIRHYFATNGNKDTKAIIGISGGKDSTIAAALLVRALGNDRVIGVLMPNGIQRDICFADVLCNHLGIKRYEININDINRDLSRGMQLANIKLTNQALINISPRLRMTVLFAVAQSLNGRVSCNSNLSETYIGYSTIFGDSAGSFAPLKNLTKTEVKLIAKELGLPMMLVEKEPSDGLCGKTDEDNFGFTYAVLDKYIRTGEIEDMNTKERIDLMHEKNLFKTQPIASFPYMMKEFLICK